jgi:hypothetical protein
MQLGFQFWRDSNEFSYQLEWNFVSNKLQWFSIVHAKIELQNQISFNSQNSRCNNHQLNQKLLSLPPKISAFSSWWMIFFCKLNKATEVSIEHFNPNWIRNTPIHSIALLESSDWVFMNFWCHFCKWFSTQNDGNSSDNRNIPLTLGLHNLWDF